MSAFMRLAPKARRRRHRRRRRRRRRSAPFDLACNPVGPRGLTDVIHWRGVRRDRNPAYTHRHGMCGSVCVARTRGYVLTERERVPGGGRGSKRRGAAEGNGGGCKSLGLVMNDETGLLLCRRARRAREGGRLLNYAVVISGLLRPRVSRSR